MTDPIRHRRRRELEWDQLAYGYIAGIGTTVLLVVVAVLVGA